MLTLQTHDTKRSADVRARLAALTWMPDEWAALARARARRRAAARRPRRLLPAADASSPRRSPPTGSASYAVKALRERKVTSNWIEPDEAHERRDGATGRRRCSTATTSARSPSGSPCPAGQIALAQKLLQLTSPGVPDVYQGDEDEFLALVDPDNRRPVDWARAAHRLAVAQARAHPRGAGRATGGQRGLRARAGAGDAVAYVHGDVFAAAAVRPGAHAARSRPATAGARSSPPTGAAR